MSAVFNQFDCFLEDLVLGRHNFGAQTFRVYLSNQIPQYAHKVKADLSEISAGFGYVAGGNQMTMTHINVSGIVTVFGTNVQFTAQGGSVGPFQYAVLYNAADPTGRLIGWWDYGGTLVLNATEAYTVVTNPSLGLFELERTS